jgi:hypothetical protein
MSSSSSSSSALTEDAVVHFLKGALVKKIYEIQGVGNKTRQKPETTAVIGELLRLYAAEIIDRAVVEAITDGDAVIGIEHLQRLLPQLMLDFE